MPQLFAAAVQTPAAQALQQRVERGGVWSCLGTSAAAQPFLAALLRNLFPDRLVVVVTESLKTQEGFHADIVSWLRVQSEEQHSRLPPAPAQTPPACPLPLFYPSWEILPHEAKLPHVDVISERLETLVALLEHGSGATAAAPVVVTNVVALLQRTFDPAALGARTRTLQRGDRIDPLDLVEWLEEQAYEPEVQVNHKGEIALRGGILDIFPLTSPWPVRLEFFGDELESIRYFDPVTQVSKEAIAKVTLPPGGELGILKKLLETRLAPSDEPGRSGDSLKVLEAGLRLPTAPVGHLSTLVDYLPRETVFLLCEPDRLVEQAEDYLSLVPAGDPFFIAWPDLLRRIETAGGAVLRVGEAEIVGSDVATADLETARPPAESRPAGPSLASFPLTPTLSLGERENASPALDKALSLSFASLDAFRPIVERAPDPQVVETQRREFFGQLHRWLRQGYAVHVFCNNEGERQRFEEIWEEYGFGEVGQASRLSSHNLPARTSPRRETASAGGAVQVGAVTEDPEKPPALRDRRDARPRLHLGALTRGFLFEEARIVVVTDAEVFGRYKVLRPRRLKSPHAPTSRSLLDIDFTELEEGDYVVHVQHGIGRYLGLQTLPEASGQKPLDQALVPDRSQECLVIEFAPRDPEQPPPKLYVPVTQAHLVSKYVGAGKARPPLNALGGTRWAKAKEQAERAVRDLASELLSIQASRQALPGHAFAPDTPWQREFEAAFLYEETPDQMRAILESKSDMERPKPMDRLICGDVGYGKTEVAIRAAFKAVMDGRQVAVLVPTTVLAQQHFNTFRERMADYPIRIELLSRFRTAREQKCVLQGLAEGAVDIVIGTHRLIQDDVAFKELGLVVIDEEQRFGVMHKEKFKLLRRLVDVLTLSATPIPRTLHLALTGARDMSTIETPPQDRLPVETIACQYDERVIRDAIQRELNRGGQVFYLHNRIFDIEDVATRLRALVPKARIVVGHGQMPSDQLEEVMTQFVNGQADVLLSTTIIESGIDIPNANTIIIDRADRFGLSDLYQLRGRVGRYKHQAYAYLLIPRHARMLTDARKRIAAIKQFSTLGSGFKIAMRDLEIRGAGNLLGPQQSGHITAVGFELYCQLLKQSISRLKGEPVKPRLEVLLRLDFLSFSPGQAQAAVQRSTFNVQRSTFKAKPPEPALPEVNVPREVATYGSTDNDLADAASHEPPAPALLGFAFVPSNYVADPRQRVEVYRKLAEVVEKSGLEQLEAELRDRFGPLPRPVDLLLRVAEIKLLASARGIDVIEAKEDKLMLTRHNDFIMLGGKFPRLAKITAKGRLDEIKRLLRKLP
jgi:transcription-repair coupling factor (superfamily II helicase)